jgi:GT2 family glycosyltransferase
MKIGICVLTFNNSEEQAIRFAHFLSGSLKIVMEKHRAHFDIVLLENGDETAFQAELSKIEEAKLSRVDSLGNIGFARGVNRLLGRAFDQIGCEWGICLNPDGALHFEALLEFLNWIENNPAPAMVEFQQFPEEHPKPYNFKTLRTPWISGCCFAMNREVFLATKGFDENFFMYCEDVDLSWRAEDMGYPLIYLPRALYFHPNLNRGTKDFEVLETLKSSVYLAWKWNDLVQMRVFRKVLKERFPEVDINEASWNPSLRAIHSSRKRDFSFGVGFSQLRWRPQ